MRHLLATLCIATLSACASVDPDAVAPRFPFAHDTESAGDDDDDTPEVHWSDVSFWDFGGEVTQEAFLIDSDPQIPCVSSMDDACGEDYWDFPGRADSWQRPVSAADLLERARGLADEPTEPLGADPEALASGIVDAWGVDFLLAEVDGFTREASVTEDWDHGYRRLQVVIHDPWVGAFYMAIHLPKRRGPFPAILAMHGHGTEAVDWPDVYHGLDYVAEGYALAAVNHRMMYANDAESDVGCMLLENGFSLLGLHAYETFVAMRFLKALPEVDESRVALFGHSAGSNKTNQFVRMSRGFKVAVTDLKTDVVTDHTESLQCHEAWVPDLRRWQDNINDFSAAPIPMLYQEYGFPDGSRPVLEFLAQNL